MSSESADPCSSTDRASDPVQRCEALPAGAAFIDAPKAAGVSTGALHSGVLPWLHEAGNPYWDWLWGGPENGRAQLRHWMARPNSELAAARLTCICEGEEPLGGYIAFSGSELRACRKADLLALMECVRRAPQSGLLERLRQARSLFAAVQDDEFYLSRLGVVVSARGRGLGRRLAEMFIQAGRARGFSRFRLDVSADNEPATRLYAALGFETATESAVAESVICYRSMVAVFGALT